MKKAARKKPSVADIAEASLAAYRAGRFSEAVRLGGQALLADPDNEALRTRYAFCLEASKINGYEPEIRKSMVPCLKSVRIGHQKVAHFWREQVYKGPMYRFLFDEGLEARTYWRSLDTLLNDEFFQLGLRTMTALGPALEGPMIRLRRALLDASAQDGMLRGKHVPLLCAIAEHCFYNEYAWYETPEEKRLVDSLTPGDAARIALLACYRPLSARPEAADWLAAHRTGPLENILRTQVKNHLEEQAIKDSLQSFFPIQEKTSQAVQAMYEENPYPRWHSVDLPGLTYPDVKLDWLTAGCGTGRPLTQLAIAFPNAAITAVDLSRTSLAYAIRKTREHGLTQIDFRHGDILDVSRLGRQFDFIESSGVLHHMKDPVAGWKALLSCLKPGGRMQIGLYSKLAREAVIRTRDYIEKKGYAADIDGIRQLRRDMLSLPDSDPLKRIAQQRDFYATSECRDLVFHIQEYNYTLPEIAAILDELGLTFLGFKASSQIQSLYREKYPADPAQTDLSNWDALEHAYPAMFAGMYKFFCCRKDETAIPPEGFLHLEKTGLLRG